MPGKILTLETLLPLVAERKRQGKRVVTTNGCFDIIHPGHTQNLAWARAQGDVLIVGINSDASVAKLKGPNRPVMGERDRAQVLAALQSVDFVFIFDEETPRQWIAALHPDIHVKGEGSDPVFLAGDKQAVEGAGGELRLAPKIEGHSTTNLIGRILGV